MPIVRSVSGLRSTLDLLTSDLIKNYANAFHLFLPKGKIVIGKDGRPSGAWIEKTLTEELIKLGRDVVSIGITPTPTVQLYIKNHNSKNHNSNNNFVEIAGGVAITASHNPSEWNGLKFLNSDGIFLDENENNKFWNFLDADISEKITNHNSNDFGEIFYIDSAIDEHIERILDIPFIKNELKNIQKYNFNVVVDAVNSSGSVAVIKLLERLNCNYEKLFCDATGIFPHTPEPLPENLTQLCETVKNKIVRNKNSKNFIGIAVDPDADRLVLIDEDGNCIGEEKTVCIAIDSYFTFNNFSNNNSFQNFATVSSTVTSSIVVNQSTTLLADIIAKNHNAEVFRSAVGEINVVKKMKETNAKIGGEGSGGVILSDCHYGRDSLVGIVLVLALLAKKQITLQQLNKNYPKLEMLKFKQEFSGDKNKLYKKIIEQNSEKIISQIDGIKINHEDSWVHLRTSNTEPIIRIIAEAPTKEQAQKLIDEVLKFVDYTVST